MARRITKDMPYGNYGAQQNATLFYANAVDGTQVSLLKVARVEQLTEFQTQTSFSKWVQVGSTLCFGLQADEDGEHVVTEFIAAYNARYAERMKAKYSDVLAAL